MYDSDRIGRRPQTRGRGKTYEGNSQTNLKASAMGRNEVVNKRRKVRTMEKKKVDGVKICGIANETLDKGRKGGT